MAGSLWNASFRPRAGFDNHFHLMRHAAAIAVVLTHAFSIRTGRLEDEPLVDLFGLSIGHFAVDVFFIISGFVVTQSLLRDGDVLRFAVSRVLRIFPALLLAVTLSAVVLGPLVSTLPLVEYFGSTQAWTYMVGAGSTLNVNAALPGVFTTQPDAGLINVPLWTLKHEIVGYGLLACLALVSLRFRQLLPPALAMLAGAYLYGRYTVPWPGTDSVLSNLLHMQLTFFLGVAAYVWRDRLVLHPAGIVALGALMWATDGIWLSEVTQTLFIAYTVLFIGFAPTRRTGHLERYGDLSYGIYIFAYPVQQTLFLHAPELGPWGLFFAALAITMPMAALSYHRLENPIMQQRNAVIAWLRDLMPSLRPAH